MQTISFALSERIVLNVGGVLVGATVEGANRKQLLVSCDRLDLFRKPRVVMVKGVAMNATAQSNKIVLVSNEHVISRRDQ